MKKSSKIIAVISITAFSLFLIAIIGFLGFEVIYDMYYPFNIENESQSLDFYRIDDVKYYVYQQKVAVTMDGDNDSLDVRTGKYRDNWLNDSSENVLKGNFEKVAWNDDKLYILSDNKYYEFDINSYEVPKYYNGNSLATAYSLKEYSKSQFEKTFKNSYSFYWYDN